MIFELDETKKKKILGPALYSARNSSLFEEYYDILQSKLSNKRNYARKLRSVLTEYEEALWEHLRSDRFRKNRIRFRRQVAKFGYVLDFYCPNSLICVEIDGEYHDYEKQQIYDTTRDFNLERLGIKTFRVPNRIVTKGNELDLKLKLQEIAVVAKFRMKAFKKQGIMRPNIIVERRGLLLGFLKYCETNRVTIGKDNSFIF